MEDVELALPLGPGMVEAEVAWCGICGSDIAEYAHGPFAIRPGRVHRLTGQEPPVTLGHEFSARVTAVGPGVTEVAVGDRVLTVCGVGAFADEVVVAPSLQQVHIIPGAMTFTQAAGFGMIHGTALHGLRQRGDLQPGETVLVLGSGGGCGSAAVGVAAAMGARVIAGASSPEKCAVAEQLGAGHVINYGTEDLRKRVLDITDGAGVDVVFDPVGGALFGSRGPGHPSPNRWRWSVSPTECPRSRIRR